MSSYTGECGIDSKFSLVQREKKATAVWIYGNFLTFILQIYSLLSYSPVSLLLSLLQQKPEDTNPCASSTALQASRKRYHPNYVWSRLAVDRMIPKNPLGTWDIDTIFIFPEGNLQFRRQKISATECSTGRWNFLFILINPFLIYFCY